MTAALKLTTALAGETIELSRKPRLGEKVSWQVSDWEKPAANDCCTGEKPEAKVRWPSGKVLYIYGDANPVYYTDPTGRFSDLASFGAAVTIGAILTTTAYQSYQIGQSLAGPLDSNGSFTDRQTGWLVLAGMSAAQSVIYRIVLEKLDKRDDSTRDLYRAIENGEYVDIVACRCFRHPFSEFGVEPTALKRFFLDASSAVRFGNDFLIGVEGKGNFHVVGVTISEPLYQKLDHEPGDRFIGPGAGVPLGLLPAFNFEVQRYGGIRYVGGF